MEQTQTQQDAGSKLLLDGTDGSSTDGGDNVDLEDGTSTYAVLLYQQEVNSLVELMTMQ